MKSILFITAVLLCLLSVKPAAAQNGFFAPYADAGIAFSPNLNGTTNAPSTNPDYRLGLGVESSVEHLLVDVNGQFDTQNVKSFNTGSTGSFAGTITGSAYLRFDHLLVGGGAFWSDQVISGNFKALVPSSIDQLSPFVGGGLQFTHDRFLVDYVLPGRNAVAGQRQVLIHNEILMGPRGFFGHVRLTQDANIMSSTPNGTPQVSGASLGVGVKFVL